MTQPIHKNLPNLRLQERLLRKIAAVLEQEIKEVRSLGDAPIRRIARASRAAVKVLLGEKYHPSDLKLPTAPEITWDARPRDENETNPIVFLEQHWGKYMDEGVLDLCALRRLDESLVEAVKTFCRNRNMDYQNYLPPPARKHSRNEIETREVPHRPSTVAKHRGHASSAPNR
jgi:hypothetical protein